MESDEFVSIRIGIVGDCGVGKSMLASQLSGDSMTTGMYSPTTGCISHVELVTDLQSQQRFFVELYDISGNPRFSSSLSVFCQEFDGIIFVWDCSSEYTFHSIESWMAIVKKLQQSSAAGIVCAINKEPDLLIVGNKADKISKEELEKLQRSCPRHLFLNSRSATFSKASFIEFFCKIYWATGGPLRS